MYNWKCQKSHFSDFHFLITFWSTFLESFLVIIRHSWGMFTDRDHTVYVFSLKEGHLERFGQSDGKHMVSVKRALRTPQTSSFMFKDSHSSFHPKYWYFSVKLISRKFSFHEKNKGPRNFFWKTMSISLYSNNVIARSIIYTEWII